MQSFLDVVLPPLLLLGGVAAVTLAVSVLVYKRLRLYATQRQRIIYDQETLTAARDKIAEIISAPDVPDDIKDKALSVYTALNNIQSREKVES